MLRLNLGPDEAETCLRNFRSLVFLVVAAKRAGPKIIGGHHRVHRLLTMLRQLLRGLSL